MNKLQSVWIVAFLAASPAWAQSFTGAELGVPDNYESQNAAANSGLDDATPTDNVDEVGEYSSDYGDYGDAVGDYGLGGGNEAGQSNGADGDYGNYGTSDGNIFGSQYDDYDKAPAANPATNVNPTMTNPAAANPTTVTNPVSTTPLAPATGTYNQTTPAANTSTYNQAPVSQADQLLMEAEASEAAVPPAAQPMTDPMATQTIPPPAEDGSLYYPTEEAPAVPLAPPLPPPNEFAGAPPVPGSMRLMAEGEAPEEYVVEPGDTLFDICDQLLDEPAYWPKLWALNPEIKNPHFIYPGMKLRFYPGDEESPPYLQVVAEEDVIPIDKGELEESALILEPIQFAAEEYAEPDPVEVIGIDQVQVGDDIMISGGSYQVPPVQMRIPGFIYSDEKEALGRVHIGRDNESGALYNTRVYIERESDLSAGTTYSILRYEREVENPQSGDFVGYLYYWVGNVQVERSLDSGYSLGRVTDSRTSAREGDIIVEFVSTNRQTNADYGFSGLSSVEGNIVGFGEEMGQIGSQGQFAFIDVGSGGGVSPGMHIPIFSTPRSYLQSNLDLDLPEDYEQVGVIRILDATPTGAVGLIVQSYDAIRIGDRTGKG